MRILQCPRCKGTELEVIEVTENVGVTHAGKVALRDGHIVPPSEFVFEPGDMDRAAEVNAETKQAVTVWWRHDVEVAG